MNVIETTPTPSDVEALQDLLASRGWQLFIEHANAVWEQEFHRRVTEAIGTKAVSFEHLQLAQSRLQQAAAIREELRLLFKWPQEALGREQRKAQNEQQALLPRRRPWGL